MPSSGRWAVRSIALVLSIAGMLIFADRARAQLPAVTFSQNVIDIPGASQVWARGINDFGVVVGFYLTTGANGQLLTHGFARNTRGQIITFDYPGATATCLYGINNFGVIVGGAGGGTVGNLGGGCQAANNVAFMTSLLGEQVFSGTVVTLPPVNGALSAFLQEAMGINDLGEIVGFFAGGGCPQGLCGFYSPNPAVSQPNFYTINYSNLSTYLMGINDAEAMSGQYYDANNQPHGFVRFGTDAAGVCTSITACDTSFSLGDSVGAFGINTGFSTIWSAYPITSGVAGANDVRLGAALYPVRFQDGTPATAYGINNYGRIAGTFNLNGRKVGFWGDPTSFNRLPAISRINPSSVAVSSTGATVNVHGVGFVKGSVVRLNGTALPTTYIDSGHISVQVPAAISSTPGTSNVTVFSPEPGGGESGALSFAVVSALPAATDVPAKPNISYLPHIVAGGGFTTYVTIINRSSAANAVVLNTIGQDGSLQGSQRSIVAPGGSYRIIYDDPGTATSTYWGILGSDQPVAVNVFFELIDSQGNVINTVGFNSVDPLSNFTLPVEFQLQPYRSVGLALGNPSSQPLSVTLQLVDSGGNSIATKLVSLGAYAQQALSLDQAPEFRAALPTGDFQGTLRVTATAPVAALALGDDIGPFFSTPPIAAGRTGQIVVPHIITGGGFVSKLTLINMSAAANSLDVKFYDQSGTLLSDQAVPLAANGMARISTAESDRFSASRISWAVINASQPAAANVFFELQDSSGRVLNTVGFNDAQLISAGTIPVQFYSSVPGGCPVGHTVGIAVANPGSTAAQVTFKLVDEAGEITTASPVTVPAGGQTAIDLSGFATFPQALTAGQNFLGLLSVKTSVPTAVLALGDDCGPFFATPPISGTLY